MKHQNQTEALNERIRLMELKQAEEQRMLREQFLTTYESLKPINLIKKTLHEITTSQSIKGDLLSSAIGIASGYITKKVLIGTSVNPIKNILGTVLQVVVGNSVSKNSETIKIIGTKVIQHFFKHKNTKEEAPI